MIIFGGLITLVGLGSAAFHGTLLFHTQMLDELPMIYAMAHWWYIWLSNIAHARSLIRPSLSVNALWLKSVWWLSWTRPFILKARDNVILSPFLLTPNRAFATYLVVWTTLHVTIGFTTVFQLHFAFLVLVGVIFTWEFQKHYPGMPAETKRLRNLVAAFVGLVLLAFTCWITDNVFCTTLRDLPIYPHGHALWHLFVGFATYVSFLICTVGNNMSLTSELPGPNSSLATILAAQTSSSKAKACTADVSIFAGFDSNGIPVAGLSEEELDKRAIHEIHTVPLICKPVVMRPVPIYCGDKHIGLPIYPYIVGIKGEEM